ncbi:U3 small nucleolar RNA-interacting protein 2, putative [Plasmodium ovale]|uniref:U3 small nucleolar RNA-interacting protein 2, putative n=2 Tax=Plasmodium ovale TaxID=36330 RepID=A0A1D3UAB4_PLAOA|nr:U3 small nucleolar RNA-interacting protein 2, putative (RRP9) [Plasmodium ovale curtisi]SBS98393.1 U3 small nucleolar RNA-interacting protein 2, putative (RRP9) [Plasmodium ovale curtisi]SCQ17079.1 U3 small nucleolar RNA-interacting protein 2, putative [Plasmodium ovale]
MKINKRKNTFKNKRNNDFNRTNNINDSEVESDDILSSNASDDHCLSLANIKKRRNGEMNSENDDDSIPGKNYSEDDENDDGFNNPEERKMYLAKKYLKDMGIQSTDEKETSDESSANSEDEEKEKNELSNNFSSDEDEEKKEKISKMLIQKDKSKNRKNLLNLGNKIKVFYDEKLSSNLLYGNKKGTQMVNVSDNRNKHDESVIFFGGHKKSVTCVACPDFNLSFIDQYDYNQENEKYYKNVYSGYNSGKFYKHNNDIYNNNEDSYSIGWHNNTNDDSSNDYTEKIIEPKIYENTSISTIYTGAKDACIIEWDLIKGEKVHIYKGSANSFKDLSSKDGISHFKGVMDIFCHKFNSFFISVGCDNLINVWDNRMRKNCMNSVVGHKNIISAVIGCNENTDELNMEHNLFTASYDKTIKLWDLRFFNKCINTYLGHTNQILNMNSLDKNKLVTCSNDYTVRVWNTVNDNHILFNINYETIESCCTLNNRIFIAGTYSGHIFIFTSSYKKPICTHMNVHNSYPVTALISIPYTNVFISGSHDGNVHFWQYKNINKTSGSVHKILTVKVHGTINKFSFAHNYKYLFVAVGDEMKHGRWTKTKNKNGLAIIPIHFFS